MKAIRDPLITQLRHRIASTEIELRRYKDALAALESNGTVPPPRAAGKRVAGKAPTYYVPPKARQRGAMIGAAGTVLSRAATPLHIDEIIRRMFADGYKHPNPDRVKVSLVRTLNRAWRRGGAFQRVGPSTYSLKGERG